MQNRAEGGPNFVQKVPFDRTKRIPVISFSIDNKNDLVLQKTCRKLCVGNLQNISQKKNCGVLCQPLALL